VIGMMWANVAMLRSVRSAQAKRAEWTIEEFDAVFAEADPRVAPAVRAALVPLYGEGVVPRPEDTLKRFLKLDRGEIDDLVADAAARLGLTDTAPVPDLPDVAALVRHLDNGMAAQSLGRP
jgi:hypothetical protein